MNISFNNPSKEYRRAKAEMTFLMGLSAFLFRTLGIAHVLIAAWMWMETAVISFPWSITLLLCHMWSIRVLREATEQMECYLLWKNSQIDVKYLEGTFQE